MCLFGIQEEYMMNKYEIKILKKGDEVLNVISYLGNLAVAVKRKKGHVDIVLIEKDEENIPSVAETWTISEGDNEVTVSNGTVKISTF